MTADKVVILSRECIAAEIPSGIPTKLAKGLPVTITQSLGGAYTVLTPSGYMVRISGEDIDALGLDVPPPLPAETAGGTEVSAKSIEELAWAQLKTCYDPEIPVNIVDLGLVYSCQVSALEEGANLVAVKFTLTAPGCGMGDILRLDIERKLLKIPGVKEARCEVLFDPPWDQTMMSEAAKLQLGMM